jgi:hypothetical protein
MTQGQAKLRQALLDDAHGRCCWLVATPITSRKSNLMRIFLWGIFQKFVGEIHERNFALDAKLSQPALSRYDWRCEARSWIQEQK